MRGSCLHHRQQVSPFVDQAGGAGLMAAWITTADHSGRSGHAEPQLLSHSAGAGCGRCLAEGSASSNKWLMSRTREIQIQACQI